MIKHGKKVLLGAGVLAALSFGGSALSVATATQPVKAAPVEQTSGPDTDKVQSGDQTTPDAASQSSAGAPDNPNAESSTESSGESGSESGSEVSNNDGPGGHADEPANANADNQFEGQQ